jgi:DNA-directed RNA polymerase specialized sigma24 family protein
MLVLWAQGISFREIGARVGVREKKALNDCHNALKSMKRQLAYMCGP